MAVCWGLGAKDGFSFSAGVIDFALDWNLATEPWLILIVGVCFAVVYYALFRFVIVHFDLKTPGREPEETGEEMERDNVG
jgi:PTS system N-acetylglucosamine-specific IIC component